MRFSIIIGFILGALPAGAGLAIPSSEEFPAGRIAYENPRSYYEAHVDLAAPERARIQQHLAATEVEMRRNPPPGLTEAQARNRLARLEDLHAYWTRGEFPKNLDFPDRLIPYFIDAAGVPCAMGYLVIQSGAGAFAEEIRATRNNAYIAEIAAVDGRLAAWGEENGITLEEAARIQPGYGPPRLSAVVQVGLDGSGKVWAFGNDANNIGGRALFYRDSAQWKLHSSSMVFSTQGGFCVGQTGEPMTLGDNGVTWKSLTYNPGSGFLPSSCAWADNDSDAWVGTRQGLWRFRRTGTTDTLTRASFKTSRASDTVTGVAIGGAAIWAATPRGLYRRSVKGTDTTVTVWDSITGLSGGRNVTGLKSGGPNQTWIGVEGVSNGMGTSYFSSRGLRRHDGSLSSALITFRATSSAFPVPSDTIYALAIHDTGSVWIAVRGGFYTFGGVYNPTKKVADLPAGATIYDMVGDSLGFYAGTSLGVYQFRNDSLVFLGVPGVSIRAGDAAQHPGTMPSRLRAVLKPQTNAVPGRTMLGRKVEGSPEARTAAGIYVSPAPAKP